MSVGTQTASEAGGLNEPTTSADIMDVIRAWKDTLTVTFDVMATDIGLIRHDMDKFRSRVSEAEECISHLEDSTRSDSRELQTLQIEVKALQEKAKDTENRLRCNNIRILGPRPAEFAETLLTQLLDLPALPPTFFVGRAHRVTPGAPIPGVPARPFLLRLLNYRDCNGILLPV